MMGRAICLKCEELKKQNTEILKLLLKFLNQVYDQQDLLKEAEKVLDRTLKKT